MTIFFIGFGIAFIAFGLLILAGLVDGYSSDHKLAYRIFRSAISCVAISWIIVLIGAIYMAVTQGI